ncbi:probable protein phosphatase 2C 9 isoform X1 [Cryptomeria japonica]|uniref:probable protein phosphatase 2C 9 isoform X1 n=2 Tax=Cryptomeria japonica TaxID=3369 RepID=UPI0025AD4B2A|nr:probable protein phosphatase 2C 9 isoform X1 [Cryptomeria japonica]
MCMNGLNCFHIVYSKMVAGGNSSCSSGKGKSHLSPNKIVYGFSLVEGKASHPMEDYHVAEFTQINGHELGLYAIFDGHLGDNVPSYLQKNLFQNILSEANFWVHPIRAIMKAYDKTDKAILRHTPDFARGGSTAVTVILIDGVKLLVANVGDSRAVVCQRGRAIQLSTDHEPSTERVSIEDKGGFVSNFPGDVPRVNGQLAVSRAFGDRSLKSHLRSDPDVREWDIDSDTEFLILASDGLWKVMDNEEATNFVSKIKDPQMAAKQLTSEALKRESKDDISCIVVQFRNLR